MIYVILMALVSLLVALFAVQNATTVEVTFLAWTFTTSLVMVIISCLIAGLFIAFCWGLKLKTQHYLKDRKRQELIADLEKEKKALQEKIDMLMHTQKSRAAAEVDKVEEKAAQNPSIPKFSPDK